MSFGRRSYKKKLIKKKKQSEMIGNRSVTRMKVNCSERRIYITLILLAIAFDSVICVTTKNSTIIENTNNCGGEFSGYQYTISSPNYPDNYPTDQDCIYLLRGNQVAKCDQEFNLQFLDFALPPSENCVQDYLEIGDRSLYCGSVAGIRRYPGKNNSLDIRFHSSTGKGGKGFKILVTTSTCAVSQIDQFNNASSEEIGKTENNRISIGNMSKEEKFGSGDDRDRISFIEAENSYPVYHPEIDLTIEDNRQSGRRDEPRLQVESQKISDFDDVQNLSNSLEVPVHRSKIFRDSTTTTTTKLEIVTPTSVKWNETKPLTISSYLFVPPQSKKETIKIDALMKFPSTNGTNDFLTKDVDNFIAPPKAELVLPRARTDMFRETGITNVTRKLPLIYDRKRINEKFIVPARSYGVPDQSYYYYPVVKVPESEIKIGEVLENFSGIPDCQGKTNLEPNLEVTANFRGKSPTLIDNIGSFSGIGNNYYYPAMTYGSPGASYPTKIPIKNVDIAPIPKYGPPNYPGNDFPGGNINVGNGIPSNWLPNANFVSSNGFSPNNFGNGNTNLFPGIGAAGRYSECCNTVYSSQRFLLASPGFPAFLYSGNSYECIYSIRPYSSNICRMRFNLNFFNHGTEDRFCTYGYVEIDGQRICGCKKGLSITSTVSSAFPITIGVKYSGYPRTKFNGFLIEVIQESCTNTYPYLSRSKKQVGNFTQETKRPNLERVAGIANLSFHRIKRNLGYSYSKPNFGLVEDVGVTQSWNSGNSVNSGIQELLNTGGISSNIFSPLATCQILSFFDWTVAAKEVYLRGARCVRNGGSGNGGSGTIIPGYPGNGGSGIIPGYPGNGGSGTIIPGYPGNGGSGIIPGYPGNGGSGIIPGYPGNGGSGIIPGYPGNGGSGIIPGYPGNGGSGTINPGYPGNGGSGTINPGYPGSGSWNFPAVKCEDVNIIEGIIASPQYPTNYPNNVNKCFRFYKAPNYCQLELAILDFDVENSLGCTKDYVAFSGQNRRYCASSLAGSKILFDVSRTNIVDMYFVSDGFGSGRGFSAGFSQIPCRS